MLLLWFSKGSRAYNKEGFVLDACVCLMAEVQPKIRLPVRKRMEIKRLLLASVKIKFCYFLMKIRSEKISFILSFLTR